MIITEKERLMLNSLGFDVQGERIVQHAEHLASENMIYAGFNTYISSDNHVFEKVGEELVEIDSPELQAERRFIEKEMHKNG